MKFDAVFEKWFEAHVAESKGERRRRLKEKYGNAEIAFLRNVWFPIFGSLDHLIPEHEVMDPTGRVRFMDNAYVYACCLWDLEVDGFGPHLRDIDRWKFADERRRDVIFQTMGWRIARFAYDDIIERPHECRRLLEAWIARFGPSTFVQERSPLCDTIVRRAMALGGEVRPREARAWLGLSDKPTLAVLRRLVADGVLEPVPAGSLRVSLYRLRPEALREYWV